MDDNKISLYEEDVYKREAPREESLSLVVFRLGPEWYGVPIAEAKEVVPVDKVTYLPFAPSFIVGIANLRGNILAVTDLKPVFGLPQAELTEQARIVVIYSGQFETGLLVDEVADIMDVPLSKIDPTLATIPRPLNEYFKGEHKAQDRLIAILNIEKILERKE